MFLSRWGCFSFFIFLFLFKFYFVWGVCICQRLTCGNYFYPVVPQGSSLDSRCSSYLSWTALLVWVLVLSVSLSLSPLPPACTLAYLGRKGFATCSQPLSNKILENFSFVVVPTTSLQGVMPSCSDYLCGLSAVHAPTCSTLCERQEKGPK